MGIAAVSIRVNQSGRLKDREVELDTALIPTLYSILCTLIIDLASRFPHIDQGS